MVDRTDPAVPIREDVPAGETITAYDRAHLKTYLRILDAERSGASAEEICRHILGIEPSDDPAAADRTLKNHLRRASWLAQSGYRQLAVTSESLDNAPSSEPDPSQ